MALPELELVNGVEKQFAINHLGHFVLINQLMESVLSAPEGRFTILSSRAHRRAENGIEFDNLDGSQHYGPWEAYGVSKLSNALCARELARRISDSNATANSLHPGGVSTGLGSNNTSWLANLIRPVAMFVLKTPAKGARTSLHLAMADSLSQTSGLYFANRRISQPKAFAKDPETARRLWEISEELCSLEPFSLPN